MKLLINQIFKICCLYENLPILVISLFNLDLCPFNLKDMGEIVVFEYISSWTDIKLEEKSIGFWIFLYTDFVDLQLCSESADR